MSLSVNNNHSSQISCIDQSTTPLVEPVKWCCRKVRDLFCPLDAAKGCRCSVVAARIMLFFIALIALVPSAFLSIFGLIYQGTCKPSAIPGSDEVHGIRPGKGQSPIPNTGFNVTAITTKTGLPLQPEDTEYSDVDDLNSKALAFFAEKSIKNKKSIDLDLSTLGDKAESFNIIDNALNGYPGFCIGQPDHVDIGSKLFLINDMKYLKSSGVKTIFVSGLNYKVQDTVDNYLSGKLTKADQKVVELMNDAATSVSSDGGNPDFSVWSIVEAAKAEGIRVVGIDNEFTQARARILKFNYLASKIIDKETANFGPDDKFCALMDNMHLVVQENDQYNTPGVSEILECPAITVRTNSEDPTDAFVQYTGFRRDGFKGKVHANLVVALDL